MSRSAKKKPPEKEPFRFDGWVNAIMGIGTKTHDKRTASKLCATTLSREEQEGLWQGDDMIARIVEMPADEMMRAGFRLEIKDSKPSARADAIPLPVPTPPTKPPGVIKPPDEQIEAQADDVQARFEELEGPEQFLECLQAERGYGGAAILLGVDDGQDPSKPLKEDRIKSFEWMNALTPQEVWAKTYYGDPRAPKYGKPETYEIQGDSSFGAKAVSLRNPVVHESRLIVFPGTATSRRHRYAQRGWGNSVLVRILDIVRDFQVSYGGAANLLTDFAQAVFKIKGLAELVAQNDDDVIVNRARLIDMCRSMARAVIIDSEEEYERKATPLSGLPELLDRFGSRLAAAADMPLTLLMGQSPGGLNATGESDIRFFYDRISARQNKYLRPRLERVLKLIMLAKGGPTNGVEPEDWSLEFNPLWQLPEPEKATMRKTVAETDKIYIDAGVNTPEEIAASRFGSRWSMETIIDLEGREQLAADYETAQADFDATQAEQAKAATVEKVKPPAKKRDRAEKSRLVEQARVASILANDLKMPLDEGQLREKFDFAAPKKGTRPVRGAKPAIARALAAMGKASDVEG